ncbi:MAG: hypothetical protein IPK22_12605 [Verrucomicrobiaceae bacterium]|nr:hypothetical protein [Verrucomicrobiaceae bacterium]
MATPSPEPQKSWQRLTTFARDASAPADLDVRVAVRAQISAMKPSMAETSLFDEVLALFGQRWLQAGFAILAVGAFFTCRDGFEVVNELAFLWQLQGPVIQGI